MSARHLDEAIDLAGERSAYRTEFMLYPAAWRGYKYARPLDWKTVRFHASERPKLPDEPGVYAFLIQPGVAPALNASYLVYVGETTSLHRRFGDYLREAKGQGRAPRIQLYSLFKRFDGYVFFTYATLPAAERKLAELELLQAFTPPLNKRLPATIAAAERAF